MQWAELCTCLDFSLHALGTQVVPSGFRRGAGSCWRWCQYIDLKDHTYMINMQICQSYMYTKVIPPQCLLHVQIWNKNCMYTVLTTYYKSNKKSNLFTKIKMQFNNANELVYLYLREFSHRLAWHNSNEDCDVQNKLMSWLYLYRKNTVTNTNTHTSSID